MKIREVAHKAENLIERGESAKQRQVYYQHAASSARSQLMAAYAMLDAASQTDEDGNPRGDVGYAQAQVFAAQSQLASAERGLQEASIQLEGINRGKRDTIREVDRYTEGESRNLSKLQELQGKRFGGNANAFIADLVTRMNSGEETKRRLMASMGMTTTTKTFSATGVNGNVGISNAISGTHVESELADQSIVGNFFRKLSLLRKKREFNMRQFGSFEVGPYNFIKGNNFDACLNDWEGYDPTRFKTTEIDEIKTISPADIEKIWLSDEDINDEFLFWNRGNTYEVESHAYFKEVASHIPEVQAALAAGRSLDELLEDPVLGKCASLYFTKGNMPTVYECDGYYEFSGNGRHRILAARELGYDIPVRVVGTRKRITSDEVLKETLNDQIEISANSSEANTKRNGIISSTLVSYGFSAKADFGNLDSQTSKDIFRAVAETKQMFPDLNLQFVGSAQSRNLAIEKDLKAEYLSAYKRHYPGASEAELLPYVNQQVAEDMACLSIEPGTIAQSLFVDTSSTQMDDIVSHYNGISINEFYGGNYEYFQQVKQVDVDAGWKPPNCNTPKATVDHELGHQIAKLVDAHNDPEIQALFQNFSQVKSKDQPKVLSGYAATNIHEFIAESWSEYRNNPDCRECAKYVAERMIGLYEDTCLQKKKVLRMAAR